MGHGPSNGQQKSEGLDENAFKRRLSFLRKALDIVLAQWLVIGFGLSCLLAYFFPGNYGQVFHGC